MPKPLQKTEAINSLVNVEAVYCSFAAYTELAKMAAGMPIESRIKVCGVSWVRLGELYITYADGTTEFVETDSELDGL